MLGIARTFTLTNRKQVKMAHTTSGQNLLELMCICMLPSCCPGHGEDTFEVKPPSLQGLGAQVETPCQPAFVLWGTNKHLFNTLVLIACPSYPDWRNHLGELSTVHCGSLCLYTSDSVTSRIRECGSKETHRLCRRVIFPNYFRFCSPYGALLAGSGNHSFKTHLKAPVRSPHALLIVKIYYCWWPQSHFKLSSLLILQAQSNLVTFKTGPLGVYKEICPFLKMKIYLWQFMIFFFNSCASLSLKKTA